MISDSELPAAPQANDVRPMVASVPSQRGMWLFGGGLVLGGLLLFQALEARRSAVTAPSTAAPRDSAFAAAGPPSLVIPPDLSQVQAVPLARRVETMAPLPPAPPTSGPRPTSYGAAPLPSVDQAARPGFGRAFPPPGGPSSPNGGVGNGGLQGGTSPLSDALERPTPAAAESKDRVKSARFLNPGTTVPKGTVVQAVLESALDSTRGGFVRALVSRDIHGFDGSRVLIQRGSRILGEYKSDVALGQRRILIQWQRLTRPDGVIIDLDSPSADPLGRAGTGGKVDTHFFERFAGAILQSSLNIGVQLAARAASNDTIVLALPGSVQQGLQQGVQPERIAPTVTVRQGTSVSVFVAKDLDFTDTDK